MEMGLFYKVLSSFWPFQKEHVGPPSPLLFHYYFFSSLFTEYFQINIFRFSKENQIYCFVKPKLCGHYSISQNSIWKEALKDFFFLQFFLQGQ